MAPEYASEGIFSIKSDIFSFGVIIFEILSGVRNSGSKQYGDFINLIGYVRYTLRHKNLKFNFILWYNLCLYSFQDIMKPQNCKQAWQLWEEGRWVDIIDGTLLPKSHSVKMMRYFNIALLCVQENAADRPTMGDVISMLSSDTMILAEPTQPAYFNVRVGNEESYTATESCSINDMTITVTVGR
jgi:serine/threonine protein kinase